MRHEAADGGTKAAKRRDTEGGRPFKERRWLPVPVEDLTPAACGYEPLELPPLRWPGDPPPTPPAPKPEPGEGEAEGEAEAAPDESADGCV